MPQTLMNSVGSGAKRSEWKWQANCFSPWRMTSLRDPVPKMCDAAHNGEVAVWLCDLSFLSFLNPRISLQTFSFTYRICSASSLLSIYLVHGPLTQVLSLGVGRKFSYTPFSFEACRTLIVCCVVICLYSHLHVERNLFPSLLGIDDWKFPHCWSWNHSSQYLQVHWFWTLSERGDWKNTDLLQKKKKAFQIFGGNLVLPV